MIDESTKADATTKAATTTDDEDVDDILVGAQLPLSKRKPGQCICDPHLNVVLKSHPKVEVKIMLDWAMKQMYCRHFCLVVTCRLLVVVALPPPNIENALLKSVQVVYRFSCTGIATAYCYCLPLLILIVISKQVCLKTIQCETSVATKHFLLK